MISCADAKLLCSCQELVTKNLSGLFGNPQIANKSLLVTVTTESEPEDEEYNLTNDSQNEDHPGSNHVESHSYLSGTSDLRRPAQMLFQFLKLHWMVRSNWAAKTAADSSNLGTVIGLRGATQDFPIRNVQWILSLTSTNLRYVTAPYAFCNASAKLCNSAIFKSPKRAGLTHLSTIIKERLASWLFHVSHLSPSQSLIGSSHPMFLSAEILQQFLGWEDNWRYEPKWIINWTGQG